jgi:hypothetical protein
VASRNLPILPMHFSNSYLFIIPQINLPLETGAGSRRRSLAEAHLKKINLVSNSTILCSGGESFKILSHTSGSVYLFQIVSYSSDSNEIKKIKDHFLIYKVNLLHHNKTLKVTVDLNSVQADLKALRIDVCLFLNGNFNFTGSDIDTLHYRYFFKHCFFLIRSVFSCCRISVLSPSARCWSASRAEPSFTF